MWVFYLPIVTWIIALSIRYRGLSFLSVNPGFAMSGLYGEKKAEALDQLKRSSELAAFELISGDTPVLRQQQAEQAIQRLNLAYPIVLKPDAGQRGLNVAVIRSQTELIEYLREVSGSVLLQQHIIGEEFGIFYMRYPGQASGKIFSITEKTFPTLVGDGQSSLEQLLMRNRRTHYMAAYLLDFHADRLEWVLPKNEVFQAVEIGSHCRGPVFLDANDLKSEELTATMDRLSQQINGFYFGRYDVRAPSKQALRNGQGIKVLEVNGVTSESTNIYDPAHSVFMAYKIMFSQWRHAFKIGQENIKRGSPRVSLIELLSYLIKPSNNKKG